MLITDTRVDLKADTLKQGQVVSRNDVIYLVIQNEQIVSLNTGRITHLHFIPNTARLNSLGARRLERYAVLLASYGGTLRFDSALDDEEIGEERMQHVHEFLTAAGLTSEQIEVTRDIPGGTGMQATEAVINVRAARQYAGARPSVPSGWERGSAEPASSGGQ